MSDAGTGVYGWNLNHSADCRADPDVGVRASQRVGTETKAVIHRQ